MESSHYPHAQTFLNNLDTLTAGLGLNVAQIIDLDTLVNLPEGTLGRELVNFYYLHNLLPFNSGPRRKQLHDSFHVLTGYGTDPLSEAEVQAFLWGCNYRPFNLILSLAIVGIISRRQLYPNAVIGDHLWKAYQRGHHSRFNPDSWQPETQWHLPLKQVQKHYHI